MVEENHCHYISSMGFRKSADVYSLHSCENMDGYKFDKLKQGNILYIKTDVLYKFSKMVNDVIQVDGIVLISGSSDYTTPDDIFTTQDEFIQFVENPKILHWFVENCVYKHNKITNFPIGLDYHTIYTCPIYWSAQKTPIEQESELQEIILQAVPFHQREFAIYSNCHFLTWTKFGGDRKIAIETIPPELLILENSPIERIETWKKQIKYAFVLSPHGNGLDCHRTWEALILGCIPIVKTSAIDVLYDDLPVVIVNNWSEITRDFLMGVIEDFKGRTFAYKKLTLEYWMEKMREWGV